MYAEYVLNQYFSNQQVFSEYIEIYKKGYFKIEQGFDL